MKSEEYFNLVKSYKLLANKSLGQNFLINPEIAEKIVSLANIEEKDLLLEVGAGLGSLSYFEVGKCDVTLIDIDERMLSFLNEHFKQENTAILRQNILKADLTKYTKIVGNLPYYITSGIIEYLLLNATNAKEMVLMCQKEVYPKLLKTFISPLSLLLNHVCDISQPLNVGRNNFAPIPHVDSVVFKLTPNEDIKNPQNKDLFKLMVRLFNYRRKTIKNCLSSIIDDKTKIDTILQDLAINEMLRPEQLDINVYINLLNYLKSNNLVSKI